jgi:hypothetical protein
MFASLDKLTDEKRGTRHAVALLPVRLGPKADFFTDPKNICIAK